MSGQLHTNGVNSTSPSSWENGGSSDTSTKQSEKPPRDYTLPLANGGSRMTASRPGVTTAFGQFAQLLHASRRPLPTQNGDGTYTAREAQTGLRQDLRHIKLKGLC